MNARGHTDGRVTTACRTFSRAIPSTRPAAARSAALAAWLRCRAVSSPRTAMTEMTSGSAGSPSRSIPADSTGTVTPSAVSRRVSSAAAMGDRQMLAVQSIRTAALSAAPCRSPVTITYLPFRPDIPVLPRRRGSLAQPRKDDRTVTGSARSQRNACMFTLRNLSYTLCTERASAIGGAQEVPGPGRSRLPFGGKA